MTFDELAAAAAPRPWTHLSPSNVVWTFANQALAQRSVNRIEALKTAAIKVNDMFAGVPPDDIPDAVDTLMVAVLALDADD